MPGQAAVASSVAVVTLLASDLLGNDRLAGLGSAAFTLGAAITSIPLSAHMRRHGRRPGLVAALLVGSLGSAVAGAGGQVRFFPLFVFGMVLFGAGQSATLQSRYVGADLASPEQRAKSIAAIVWVGTLGAVFAPIFTPYEKDFARLVGLDELVGPYVFGTTLFLVSAAVMFARLRPDPLVVLGATNPHAERPRPLRQVQASYGVIRRSPGAVLGLASMAGAQAAMVAVMAMTPAHMKDHGHADLSAFVIAVHILGMFGLSPARRPIRCSCRHRARGRVWSGRPLVWHDRHRGRRLRAGDDVRRSVPARARVERVSHRRHHVAHRLGTGRVAGRGTGHG